MAYEIPHNTLGWGQSVIVIGLSNIGHFPEG